MFQLGGVVVEGRDVVVLHPLEKEGEREAGQLCGFAEAEAALPHLFQEPELTELGG